MLLIKADQRTFYSNYIIETVVDSWTTRPDQI